MLKKLLKVLVLTLMTYLFQVSVAQHIAIAGVSPNLVIAVCGVAAVALGRKYVFCMALALGYLLEIMLPALDYINLILYPVCCMLSALLFADKTERKLEEERTNDKSGKQWDPRLRTMLCAGMSIIIFEGVNLFYIYLTGVVINSGHWTRALICTVYTTLLAGVVQFPLRRWLGIHKLPKAR